MNVALVLKTSQPSQSLLAFAILSLRSERGHLSFITVCEGRQRSAAVHTECPLISTLTAPWDPRVYKHNNLEAFPDGVPLATSSADQIIQIVTQLTSPHLTLSFLSLSLPFFIFLSVLQGWIDQ